MAMEGGVLGIDLDVPAVAVAGGRGIQPGGGIGGDAGRGRIADFDLPATTKARH